MEVATYNYKSDFDFILHLYDCQGNEVEFPDYDFEAVLYTYSKAVVFTASQKNGVLTNCYNDNGKIHIICNDHKLGCGDLKVEFIAELPQDIYPDGLHRIVAPQNLGIRLVSTKGDCPTTADAEVIAPYVNTSAYKQAVLAGYQGTEAEYIAALNNMPEIVRQAENLNAFLGEWAKGKQHIIDALSKWDMAADVTDSFEDLSDKILELPVRGQNEEGVIANNLNGSSWDLLNELNNHQRKDYPYCWGIMFSDAYDSVELNGADAYYTSDGAFYESNTTHEFVDNPSKIGRYIIYYYRDPDYWVNPSITNLIRLICFSGKPKFNVGRSINLNMIESYVKEPYDLYNNEFNFNSNNIIQKYLLNGIRSINGNNGFTNNINFNLFSLPDLELWAAQTLTYMNTGLEVLKFPSLKKWSGGYISRASYSLKKIVFPELTEFNAGVLIEQTNMLTDIVLPNLEILKGNLANSCSGLITVNLPLLRKFLGGVVAQNCVVLTDVNLPKLEIITGGTLIAGCAALTSLDLPELTEMTGGIILNGCKSIENLTLENLTSFSNASIFSGNKVPSIIELPNLERSSFSSHIINGASESYDTETIIRLPKFKSTNGVVWYVIAGLTNLLLKKVTIEFGAPQDGYIYISQLNGNNTINVQVTVQEGFRSYLNISYFVSMTKESLESIIDNLADNTEYDTIQIVFGSTNLAKVSDEKKLLATNKNYTLS